jgi:hypothetical protein
MNIPLGNGKHATIDAHSDHIWHTIYNGVGATVGLTPEQAMEVGLTLWQLGRRVKKGR